jgi:4-hydroxybenzoate polyprenyltransferase
MSGIIANRSIDSCPVSIFSFTFWKSYWITMRPYLTFISGAAALVGLAFIPDPDYLRVIMAFIPLFLSYGLGQALTDCFQIDTDSISSPYRPLTKGIISVRQVLSVSLAGLLVSIVIMAYLNIVLIAFGVLVVLGLLSYTRLKRTWWGGPPWNSWIVAMLPIMGRFTASNSGFVGFEAGQSYFIMPLILSVIAVFFGYANFVVMGYFKDISADRRTGYNTFPVVFGWKAAAIYSDITAAGICGFTALAILLPDNLGWASIAVFIAALSVNLYAQVKIHRIRDENLAHGPISNVVRAFVLYCIAIVLSLKGSWLFPLLLYYLLFEISLKLRPERSQV